MSFEDTFVEFFAAKDALQWILFVFSVLGIFEWLVFTVLNTKTFLNVLKNPDRTTSVAQMLIVAGAYLCIRCLFLPIYFAGAYIQIPVFSTLYAPILYRIAISILTIWWNVTLLLPCITVWYSRMRYGIGNTPMRDTREPYHFIVVLPVYNETMELLVAGVESIVKSNYPADLLQIHVAFDNDDLSELYLGFAQHFGVKNVDSPSVSVCVNGITLWLHRFTHAGKRLTQAKTWDFIKNMTMVELLNLDKTILLFTDSDNYMYDNALRNLAYNFERNEGKLAFAGYMTCMTKYAWWNVVKILQDTEYVAGEMNRAFEMLMGTVNCLPGGFTAMRYGAFDSIADTYFTDLPDDTITDYHRNYLGEDRYLTHIMHQRFPRHSMGFCPSARCKTDPPATVLKLVQQRRRWYLGALANEAYMFSDRLIWAKYKFMVVYKLVQLCWWRSFTLSQVILAIFMFREMNFVDGWNGVSEQVLAVTIPLFLSWLLVSETGFKIQHYKVILVYPFSHIPQTIIAFFVDWYTIFTLSQRSWGGNRVQNCSNVAIPDNPSIEQVIEQVADLKLFKTISDIRESEMRVPGLSELHIDRVSLDVDEHAVTVAD
jgi:chitin synthase